MTYRKISHTFGDWGRGVERDEAHALFVEHPENGVVHVVDCATEEETEANMHRPEWSGWTYVADNAGVERLRTLYANVDVVDTIGFDPDEVSA